MVSGERYVFLHFDVSLSVGEERFEIRVKVPDKKLLVIQECQVALVGDDKLVVDQGWCDVSGDGVSDGGLRLKVNGADPAPFRPPRLLLNQVTATRTPQGARLYVIGPSNLYLPTTGEAILRYFRYPATEPATAIFSLTGIIQPYEPT